MYNKMNYPFNMIKKRDKVTLHLAQVKLSRSSKTLITI